MKRYTRYQGAIIQNNHILLINHCEHKTGRSYWIFPGGGIESGETEEECVQREMKEETNLDVRILSLLFNEPYYYHGRAYQRIKTYFCEPIKGKAGPGIEPEPASHYSIVAARWFDLRSDADWNPLLVNDPIIYLPLQHFRRKLVYLI